MEDWKNDLREAVGGLGKIIGIRKRRRATDPNDVDYALTLFEVIIRVILGLSGVLTLVFAFTKLAVQFKDSAGTDFNSLSVRLEKLDFLIGIPPTLSDIQSQLSSIKLEIDDISRKIKNDVGAAERQKNVMDELGLIKFEITQLKLKKK